MSSESGSISTRTGNSFGSLYALLAEHFPGHRSQQRALGISQFAKAIGRTHETVYRGVREEKPLSVDVAFRIIQLSRTDKSALPLCWEDLIPYTLPEFREYSRDAQAEVEALLG